MTPPRHATTRPSRPPLTGMQWATATVAVAVAVGVAILGTLAMTGWLR